MGGNFRPNLPVWTSVCLVFVVCVATANQGLLQDLGLNVLPDISKINISLDEYTGMMNTYLQTSKNDIDGSTPKLITFNVERKAFWRRQIPIYRLVFDVTASPGVEVKNAQLRILAPPATGPTTMRIQVNQVMGARRKRYIDEKIFYLSGTHPKWCEVDITGAVQSWIDGDLNLGLDLVCLDFDCDLNPIQTAITALIYPEKRRIRRSSPYQSERRTDCARGRKGGKRKCCRQNMKVNFKKLDIPEMSFIVEPKVYEAGYCFGLCPPNYNHATNHSRIQSLMHQMEKRNASKIMKRRIPKACCAPSKLGPLEILLVNKDDPTKLMLEKWDNMQVIECACS